MLEKLKYLTSGESHGKALLCVIDGVPANLSLSEKDIASDLARRQKGHGRGGRMKIETDHAQILSGVRWGKTLGSPIGLMIENRDWANWDKAMSPLIKHKDSISQVTRPRPGHADLSGAIKYGHKDVRNVLERSSARETATRTALGAIAKRFLAEFDIKVMSYVTEIGGIEAQDIRHKAQSADLKSILSMFKSAEASAVRCPDKKAEKEIIARIDRAMKDGDTLGGVFEIVVTGVPVGLGSYSQWNSRLNAKISYGLMGIQAMKGVEIGLGFESARRPGSKVMDEIYYSAAKANRLDAAGGFYRKSNNAGGIEGGMSTGMPIVVRTAMKPIPTLRKPLSSVDIKSKKKFNAAYERSDVCAVPAASVVGEAVVALVIADSFLMKFGGDSMEETKRNFKGYLKQISEF
ncbi:MAG: chorismate synthase [Thermodesulfovibrionia bacterium]|nr:chorismate synthase [Thermodesulfovibrionia bacterium]